jgi:hypothetical protein
MHSIPEDHPLRRMFRHAVDKAFTQRRELYTPQVAAHISDDILCDFVHTDRIYRFKDAGGCRLDAIQEMLPISAQPEGPERRLEVDRYIGDFALFMLGFFPTTLGRSPGFRAEPLLSKVGSVYVEFRRSFDYYTAEGRKAYERAAETARLFDPDSRVTYTQLASDFEGYQGLLGSVRRFLWEDREFEDEFPESVDGD